MSPPPSTSQPLLLGNQQSSSNINSASAPPAPSLVVALPPPSAAPASAPSTFPAPMQVLSSATDDAADPYNLEDSLGFGIGVGTVNPDTAHLPDTYAAAGGSL